MCGFLSSQDDEFNEGERRREWVVRFGKEEGKEQIKIDYGKGNRSWILTRREKGSRSEYRKSIEKIKSKRLTKQWS
jgi:hypothetical protein